MTINFALYHAATDADNAWQDELTCRFGANAGTVRYTAAGRGEPGSQLRQLYDRFVTAAEAWRNTIQAAR